VVVIEVLVEAAADKVVAGEVAANTVPKRKRNRNTSLNRSTSFHPRLIDQVAFNPKARVTV
jgi:hypothetical protein